MGNWRTEKKKKKTRRVKAGGGCTERKCPNKRITKRPTASLHTRYTQHVECPELPNNQKPCLLSHHNGLISIYVYYHKRSTSPVCQEKSCDMKVESKGQQDDEDAMKRKVGVTDFSKRRELRLYFPFHSCSSQLFMFPLLVLDMTR